MKKLKVLFFAEGATLAHVVRPLTLAKGLDTALFDIVLCRPESFSKFTNGLPFPVLDLDCQEAAVFAHRLEYGLPLYDFPTLCRYVDVDLALIDREKPDIVIGDFRLSLSVSARLRSVPYIAICDAYWSPERPLHPPLPVLALTRFVPITLAKFLFDRIAPLAFRLHALPLERLRAKFGLTPLGYDLRQCYTDADFRLFANFRALFPEVRTNSGSDFIGPITWSPNFDGNMDFFSGEGPLTYITMGSSGNPNAIENIIPILERFESRILIATAGKPLSFQPKRPTTQIFDYLPGSIICQHADLVICNGGSPTTNQALSEGVPVLGICENMDQFLNMDAICKYGAGLQLRSDQVSQTRLYNRISTLMIDQGYAARASHLAKTLSHQTHHGVLESHIKLLCR